MSNTLKVDEIKKILTDAGVTFDEKMKKEELLQLMEEANLNEVENDTAPLEEPNQVEETQRNM